MCDNFFLNFLADKILSIADKRFINIENERNYYKNRCRTLEKELEGKE